MHSQNEMFKQYDIGIGAGASGTAAICCKAGWKVAVVNNLAFGGHCAPLTRVPNASLGPMLPRRVQHAGNMSRVREALERGRGRARVVAKETMEGVHVAIDLDYLRKYR